ncbi:MAG: hypothetical protein MI802_02045 [Desulfobacterales bacterium]|nr:hypothetical protein [Desulfobacterales bacterium]
MKFKVLALWLILMWAGSSALASELVHTDCPERIRCFSHGTSRSLFCMDFSGASPRICTVGGIVGGEHITTIRLTGDPGDTFLLKFFSISGRPGFSIPGDHVSLTRLGNGQSWVSMDEGHTTVDLHVSAHPFGKYRFLIKKL